MNFHLTINQLIKVCEWIERARKEEPDKETGRFEICFVLVSKIGDIIPCVRDKQFDQTLDLRHFE